MDRKTKFRILSRGLERYLSSQNLHQSIEEIEQDIRTVERTIAQLVSKCDKVENYYGIEYKMLNAQIQGLVDLEEFLHHALEAKKALFIPCSFLKEIINDEDILDESMIGIVIKTYFNINAGEDAIASCKDSLSQVLHRKGMSHRDADLAASNIANNLFGGSTIINTRKKKEKKYQRFSHGGYLRNHHTKLIADNKDNESNSGTN